MYFDERTENLPVPVPVKYRELTAVQQHCLEAAQYLRKYGWLRGQWTSRHNSACLMGAVSMITEAATPLARNTPPYASVYKHLHNQLGRCPVAWNDGSGRTKEQVIELLEKAAEVAEG